MITEINTRKILNMTNIDTNKIIHFTNGIKSIPDQIVIPFIEGDGCGPEVMRATHQTVDAAVRIAYQSEKTIIWKEILAGQKAYSLTGSWLPEETLQVLRECHIGIKGPLSTPVGDGIRSLNVALRKELDLFACLRPIRYYPGAPSPLRNPENIDIILFRENTEDVYAGIEFAYGSSDTGKLLEYIKSEFPDAYSKIRFPETSALSLKPVSREGSERIIRSAIQWALQNQRKKVTILHKGNIMKFTEGGFLNWGYALAEREFGDEVYSMNRWKTTVQVKNEETANQDLENAKQTGELVLNDMIVDASFEWAIVNPREMDVLVTTNLNGDYLSDALAALVGGLGIAPGANINFATGDAIFEATHGTAPKIAGNNQANPGSLILSSVLMLRYLGWDEAANLIENGMQKTLASRKVTADFFYQMKEATLLTTSEFTNHIIRSM